MKESLPSPSSPHKERYGSLDGLRTLACIGIVLMHVRANNALQLHLEQWVTDPDLNYWLTCLLVLCGAICFAWGWKRFKSRCIK